MNLRNSFLPFSVAEDLLLKIKSQKLEYLPVSLYIIRNYPHPEEQEYFTELEEFYKMKIVDNTLSGADLVHVSFCLDSMDIYGRRWGIRYQV
jgi:hypothetical protein